MAMQQQQHVPGLHRAGNAPELATQVVETGKPLLVLAESAR
jgi:hypothetical protein